MTDDLDAVRDLASTYFAKEVLPRADEHLAQGHARALALDELRAVVPTRRDVARGTGRVIS